MSNTEYRLISERYRAKGGGDPFRRWLALILVVVSISAAVLIFSRDTAWESRRKEARRLGLAAENGGRFPEARAHYETALVNHPYDWRTHLSLANLLNHRLNAPEDALRHYLYALAYAPEPALLAEAGKQVEILKLMRRGELENPHDAIEDMFLAMEAGAESIFYRRLSIILRHDAGAYWEGWRRRGRGTVTRMRIVGHRDGFYDALAELDFPDETSMSLHLYCPLKDIWRLEVGFP